MEEVEGFSEDSDTDSDMGEAASLEEKDVDEEEGVGEASLRNGISKGQ